MIHVDKFFIFFDQEDFDNCFSDEVDEVNIRKFPACILVNRAIDRNPDKSIYVKKLLLQIPFKRMKYDFLNTIGDGKGLSASTRYECSIILHIVDVLSKREEME